MATLTGYDASHRFRVHYLKSRKTQRLCTMCGGRVRRSWKTGILHSRCRFCRYLVMMYGPSIEVEQRVE